MAETSLPVDHLFTITATLGPATAIEGGPNGSRRIIPVTGGTFEGPRLKGTIAPGPGGDWVLARPDGSVRLDVRLTLLTDDGAAILMSYSGIGAMRDGGFGLRTAPQFETGDARYAWLNAVQAVGIGRPGEGGGSVSYDVYALR
jgi:hypothetical protein